MKSIRFAVLLLAIFVTGAMGAHKKGQPAEPMHKIAEVSASSITLSFGETGDIHESFKITEATTVTVDGAPAHVGDLRAGMVAVVKAGADKSAASITAKGAPAHPGRHRVG